MEYNNDNRTPLDRIDEDFLDELFDSDFERFSGMPSDPHSSVRRGVYRVVNSEVRDETNNGSACENCGCADSSPCGCGDCRDFKVPHLKGVPLSMVYSPYQEWENIYDPETALKRGTIFKCLDFPFMHAGCDCRSTNKHGR